MNESFRITLILALLQGTIWATPNEDLWKAAEAYDANGIEAALKNGADPKSAHPDYKTTALHLLFETGYGNKDTSGRLRGVQLLLAAGADPNALAYSNQTPPLLKYFCDTGETTPGDLEAVREMVKAGANLNAVSNGRDLLGCAIARRESFEAVRLLLELGVEPNPISDGGGNYVHTAAVGYKRKRMEDSGKIIDLLIKYGVDFDTPNDEGNTPLHTAALDGNEYALRAILKHKPKIDRKNNEGKTAYELALKKKAKSETDAFERKLAAMIKNAGRGANLTEIGEVFAASEQQVDITGKGIAKVKAGEKLLVRTARGDYTLVAGENMHTKLKAKTSPAAAARLTKGDKVFLKK